MFSTLFPLFLKIQQLFSTVKMTEPFVCIIRIFFKTLYHTNIHEKIQMQKMAEKSRKAVDNAAGA